MNTIQFETVYDADFDELADYFEPSDTGLNEIEVAKRALYAAKPVPLTGKVRVDADIMYNFIKSTFEPLGFQVGDAVVDSPNFGNEMTIDIMDKTGAPSGYYFETMLDYNEYAYSSGTFDLQLNFTSPDGDCVTFAELASKPSIESMVVVMREALG